VGLDERTEINSCGSYALVSTIATDLGNTSLYSWLASGGVLHVFSKEMVSHIEGLHAYFKRHRIDCLKIVPSHWKALALDGTPLLPARMLIFGGESLKAGDVEMIRGEHGTCRVFNHYGPTETTVGKLVYEVNVEEEYEGIISIGKPFSNSSIYILSAERELCPIGVPGQLYITGDGLARGYLNNADLTQQKFISNPYSKETHSLMYATGDLVKYLPDGNVMFLGRVDDQVKIRGYRVELGEIESVLSQCSLVRQGVVVALEDKQENKRLVGYVVPDGAFDREGILSYLKEKLPEYMVPAVLVELDSLPLAANGKIDRKALPDPDISGQSGDSYVAPRTATEEQLAGIWQDILEVDQVGIHDDFFALGGHSLLAVRLISAIRKAFQAELPIGDVFDYPTVAQLAGQLDGRETSQDAATPLLPAVGAEPRPEKVPLSFSQERLWFIDRLEGSLQYHVPAVLKLSGKLDAKALGAALKEIVNRHEVLRTVIREEGGQAWQEVREVKANVLTEVDGSEYVHNPQALQSYIREIIQVPFNLSEDTMLRAHLIRLEAEEQVLVVTLHHIASDGWSRSILVGELVELYASFTQGRKADLPNLSVQYADYALWQRKYLEGEVLDNKLSYWKEKLQNVSPLELPTDHIRPAVQGTAGSMIHFSIEEPLARALQALSQKHGATLYMTLLSAFKVLLYRYSGQQDICVGSPIAGRQQQELEGLIGFFVNTLALRSQVEGEMPFTGLLESMKASTMEAYANQEIPFEKVVEAVSTGRDLSRNPLFQVMFILRNTPEVPELRLGEVSLSRGGYQHSTSLFDLSLYLTETGAGLQGAIEYSTELYEPATIERMAEHFSELLRSIISKPEEQVGKLSLLGTEEKAMLQTSFNATAASYPSEKTLMDLFQEQAAQTPQAQAVVFGEATLSYQELNERANRLAHYLLGQGLKPGQMVPVCIERSINMITAILAILKAGGVYVPIDPEYPFERIAFMLEDSGAALVLSSKESRPRLGETPSHRIIEVDGAAAQTISSQPTGNPQTQIQIADQLVYVIYTSGSTGRPKGVRMGQSGMVNLLHWQQKQFTNKQRRVLQFASLTFDVSFQEIFSTLCFGSTLYLIEETRRKDMSAMLEDISRYGITHLFVPYIVLKSLVEYAGTLSRIPTVPEEIIVAGEQLKLTEDICRLITERGIRLVNQYGPTEAHVVSSYTISNTDSAILPPIGKPVDNTRLYVLNSYQELCPVGVPGELYIGGVQVARGYLNRPELTAEKFITDPFSTGEQDRLYKTGDLARWLLDGNLEYLGRIDDQVKVRGYRIELGEIESVIQQSGLVSQGVVVAKEDANGYKRLIGYAVFKEAFDKEALMNYLHSRLPDYMVPAVWVELDSLPVTPNGKVDKKALPAADMGEQLSKGYVAPRNELEEKLARIWQELLGLERVGIHDNFFELGGHSLLVMKMVSHIKKELMLSIPIQSIFKFPSIYELANYLEMAEDEDTTSYEEIDI
jgi:amino acid adenylation domain-containing protein